MSGPRIVVYAYSGLGHACLTYLLHRGENVVAVHTHRDNPGETLWFPSVRKLALDHGTPVRTADDPGCSDEVEFIRALRPNLILSFYYRSLLPASILSLADLGAFNIHGSMLPRYRGRAPVNWAVINGEQLTGATLHVMTERADAGDIVDQQAVPIGPEDTAGMVQACVDAAAVGLLARQLENLKSGKAPRTPQQEHLATRFGRRRPEDGRFSWDWPARRIHDLVRGVTRPFPGAFAELAGRKTFIWKTRLSPIDPHGFVVTCGDGAPVEILLLQREGGPEMTGLEFSLTTMESGRSAT